MIRYHNSYQRLRVRAVQEFDRMFYEPHNQHRSHKSIWRGMGCFIFGLSYQSYLSYLRKDVSDVPPLPSEALRALERFAARRLAPEGARPRGNAVESAPTRRR